MGEGMRGSPHREVESRTLSLWGEKEGKAWGMNLSERERKKGGRSVRLSPYEVVCSSSERRMGGRRSRIKNKKPRRRRVSLGVKGSYFLQGKKVMKKGVCGRGGIRVRQRGFSVGRGERGKEGR